MKAFDKQNEIKTHPIFIGKIGGNTDNIIN